MPTGDRPSIIIPVHRAREDVHDCLASLRTSGDLAAAEVVVVDDFSDDGTAEMVEQDFPDVTLVRRTRNGGFARAVNTGMTRVPAASRFVALLNSDTTVEVGWLQAAIEAMERDESVGAVSDKKLMGLVLQETSALDAAVADHLEAAFPVVNVRDSFEHVKTLLARGHDAVLVREGGRFEGILTRGDVILLLTA